MKCAFFCKLSATNLKTKEMIVIQFTKDDFIEGDLGFYFKAPFENPSDHFVSVIRIEDDGSETSLVKDTRVLDGLVEIGVSTEDLTFNGKILIK